MNDPGDITEYIEALRASKRLGNQVVYATSFDPCPARYAALKKLDQAHAGLLKEMGFSKLYTHQQSAISAVDAGKHIVVSTPTASGKTLIYNLPVIRRIMDDPSSRSLYLFPLKALAQDQLRTFTDMAARCHPYQPTAAIYDGDTTAWHRKKIRENPPNVILTNPEMLHLSFLPYHTNWASFFSNIDYVVVDEVHTYRGVMGSHMAQIFRRFRRICDEYNRHPVFIFCSATIANPVQLTEALTGLTPHPVTKTGAPEGKRHLVFINPVDSPAHTAILLLKSALHRNLRTIVYTQSRKMTELISLWAGSQKGRFAGRISAYRAGFLPEERREIERKLVSGEILAVISTSALELGIDIGDLDLCILVGYPGTIMATRQRGGRVGRSGRESAVIMIGGQDALDQYILRNAAEFIRKDPESAVVNPENIEILRSHLVCAASEKPLSTDEPMFSGPVIRKSIDALETKGALLRSAEGDRFYAARRSPHRHISLRGTGSRFSIIDAVSGDNLGEIDGFRAFRETHPGAVYLHQGESYCVRHLDLDTLTVKVMAAQPNYFTRVRAHKETEILDVIEENAVGSTQFFFGRLKVTDQVTGYEKRQLRDQKRINILPLDLPPQMFETEGIWFKIPAAIQKEIEARRLHFMGGIHAVEHAAIGICPLFILTDRNDLGGISIPYHPQVDSAAIFVYDSIPGGIGLSRAAFAKAELLLERTRSAIASCNCENGCPACIHSPKCGSGNRPLDKDAALRILALLLRTDRPDPPKRSKHLSRKPRTALEPGPEPEPSAPGHFGVLDIETQRSAAEVGGWNQAHRMGVSCAVLYDSAIDSYLTFLEADIPKLVQHLGRLDLIVGFNIKRFDYQVLRGYVDFDFSALSTLDILEDVHRHLGYRLSLDHIATESLGVHKTADGLQALRWWQEGRIDEIVEYCKKDVEITKDLFLYGKKNAFLLFRNKAGQMVRIPVSW